MHCTTPYDLIVTASVIGAILFVACKPEFCARIAWKMLRVLIPTGLVGLEIFLFLTAPHLALALLAITLVGYALWQARVEYLRLSNPHAGNSTLSETSESHAQQVARWEARQALERQDLELIAKQVRLREYPNR